MKAVEGLALNEDLVEGKMIAAPILNALIAIIIGATSVGYQKLIETKIAQIGTFQAIIQIGKLIQKGVHFIYITFIKLIKDGLYGAIFHASCISISCLRIRTSETS